MDLAVLKAEVAKRAATEEALKAELEEALKKELARTKELMDMVKKDNREMAGKLCEKIRSEEKMKEGK